MGYTDLDKLNINTIRLLAVSALSAGAALNTPPFPLA
jgi:hypothetical protein